jgi:hypothetical protein
MKLRIFSFSMFFVVFLVSCGPGQLFGPTLTPSKTPIIIKEGNWSGMAGELSFEIKGTKIINLSFDFKMNQEKCKIDIDEIEITNGNSMTYEYWEKDIITQQGYEMMKKYGIPAPSSRDVEGEKQINTFTISGTFTNSTTIAGNYSVKVCGQSIGNVKEKWNAKWSN